MSAERFNGLDRDSRLTTSRGRGRKRTEVQGRDERFEDFAPLQDAITLESDQKDRGLDHPSHQAADASDSESSVSSGTEDSILHAFKPTLYLNNDQSSKYLAVVNLPWDHIKAADIYVLVASFLPAGGAINYVRVFQSEFGHQRYQEEAVNGPPLGQYISRARRSYYKMARRQAKTAKEYQGKKGQLETLPSVYGNSIDMYFAKDPEAAEWAASEGVRHYELDRMRYALAVVSLNSDAAADTIYASLNGLIYEHSSCELDIRYMLPEDVAPFLDPDGPKLKLVEDGGYFMDECTAMPVRYTSQDDFDMSALQHCKPRLTWDQTDPARTRIMTRKLTAKDLEEWENDPANQYINDSSLEHSRSDALLGDWNSERSDSTEELLLNQCAKEKTNTSNDIYIRFDPVLESNLRTMSTSQELTPFQKAIQERRQARLRQADNLLDDTAPERGKRSKGDPRIPSVQIREDIKRNVEGEGSRKGRRQTPTQEYNQVIARQAARLEKRIDAAEAEKRTSHALRLKKELAEMQELHPWLRNGSATTDAILEDSRFADIVRGEGYHIDRTSERFREAGDLSSLVEAQRRAKL